MLSIVNKKHNGLFLCHKKVESWGKKEKTSAIRRNMKTTSVLLICLAYSKQELSVKS